MGISKEQHLFEFIEIFCSNIYVFTLTEEKYYYIYIYIKTWPLTPTTLTAYIRVRSSESLFEAIRQVIVIR